MPKNRALPRSVSVAQAGSSSSSPILPSAGVTEPAARWSILAVLSMGQLLGMSLWFTASATSVQLADRWSLDAGDAAFLTTAVQIGFVAGTALAALLNLADLVPARRYFAVSAIAAAAANAALLIAAGPLTAAASRFLTGFFLAGVYPPAMKMAATWFRSGRGLAIGTVVGALTVGKAMPYLIGALGTVDYRFVIITTSLGALAAAALIAVAYRDGPFPFPSRPFSLGLVGTIIRHRETRLAIGGYLGHMWELYAGWATLGSFFLYYFGRAGWSGGELASVAAIAAFASISAGGVGSVVAGICADRLGRENVATWSMAISGSCAILLGWMVDRSPIIVVTIALIWGFAIVADSAQFSALVTEVAPAHAVGTALTLQTSLGFALTAASIWATIEMAQAFGWGVAFTALAIGPALGIASMIRLRKLRTSAPPS